MTDRPPGEALIPQCETRKVGDTTYISVPGPVPVIEAARPVVVRRAERPPVEYVENGHLRRCARCDYWQVTHVGVTAEAQHICHRDGVTYLILWPRC